MDVFEDYVWLWVILEFIFFLVMGLECVGDWLLVGEGFDVLVYSLDFGGYLWMIK